jgi:uncharacterized protein
MLIGMALYKLGVLTATHPARHYAAMAAAGFGVGVLAFLFGSAWDFAHGWSLVDHQLVADPVTYWAAPVMALGWIGLVMLLLVRGWRMAILGDVGRLALTNYLLQSLVCSVVFYGHGLGWFGRVDRPGQLAIVVAIWLMQLAGSRWWLRHFTAGPAEWAWRTLAYGQRRPLVRRPGAE